MSTTQTAPDGVFNPDTEFQLALTSGAFADLQRALATDTGPNADEPERGTYCVITQSTGHDRVTYLIQEVVMPDEGDVWWLENEGLQFDPDYRHEATERAKSVDGGGILIVHTHPNGSAGPSRGDYGADAGDLYTAAQRLPPDAPLAAGVRSDSDGSWHIRACNMSVARTPAQRDQPAFGPSSATWTPATAIRVVGETFEKHSTTAEATGPAGVAGSVDSDLVDSSEKLWAHKGQKKLAGLRIGVVGAGGGGSILAEWLPRLGVGELVLVDFDRLEKANFNRHQGATRADIRNQRLKVRVSARVATRSAVAENFEVRPVVGSIVESKREEYDPLQHLLDCDIIINAADPHWARKVLDDLGRAHVIPVIDAGTDLDVDEQEQLTDDAYSNVALSAPGHPCLNCSRMWDAEQVSADKEGENEGYLDDNDDEESRAPSVIFMNGLVESLALQRLAAYVLDVAPNLRVGVLRYLPADPDIRWRLSGTEEQTNCDSDCDRDELTAAGDSVNVNLDRRIDPRLSDHLENGLTKHGIVDPAPVDESPEPQLSLADDHGQSGGEPETTTEHDRGIFARLRDALPI